MATLAIISAILPLAASSELDVGFCHSDGSGFLKEQPADQLERWNRPYDNGTHLLIDWRPDRSVLGRNVTEYFVDVTTSVPVLNLFIGRFGSFPQDLCAPGGSQARNAVDVSETNAGATCTPYERARPAWRQTSFPIPDPLRAITNWNVVVTVRGYGAHAPVGGGEASPATWWCHKYARGRGEPTPARSAGRRLGSRRRLVRAHGMAAAALAAPRRGLQALWRRLTDLTDTLTH